MIRYIGSDRREFFRINDTVVIDYKVVEQEDIDSVANRILQTRDTTTDEHARLRTIQTTLNHLLEQINQNDRDIARALRLMDEKINILSESIQRQYHPVEPEDMVEANLSGGGVAFMVAEPIDARNTVELNLQLLPSATQIHALAKVISCDRIENAPADRPYHLRMAFTEMDEQDRNLLVKHTLNRQAEALRAGRPSDVMSVKEI